MLFFLLLQITNPAAVTVVTAVETATAATEEATVEVAVATETADLEVVTNPVATGEESIPCLMFKERRPCSRTKKSHSNTHTHAHTFNPYS